MWNNSDGRAPYNPSTLPPPACLAHPGQTGNIFKHEQTININNKSDACHNRIKAAENALSGYTGKYRVFNSESRRRKRKFLHGSRSQLDFRTVITTGEGCQMLPRTVAGSVSTSTEPTSPIAPLPSTETHGVRIDAEHRWGGEVVLARITGELDLLSTPVLRRWIIRHTSRSRPRGLVLDMRDVVFLSASGLGVLSELDGCAAHQNFPWALVAATRVVLRPLQITGLETRIPLYRSTADAVEAVRATAHMS